ncbi:MAG: hypothetical protein JW768_14655 [Chitinispirillaceae bacterium]|nr:hypothetical protein [Chitinispirillaceae bacterium]
MTRSARSVHVHAACLAALVAVMSSHAALQLDATTGFLLGFSDTAAGQVPVRPAFGLGGALYGTFILPSDIHLTVENALSTLTGLGAATDDATGREKELAAAEQNVPTSNDGSIRLRYEGFHLGYRNIAYAKNRPLDLPYIERYFYVGDPTGTNGFFYKKKFRHVYEGSYELTHDRFILNAELHHVVTQGAIDTMLNRMVYVNESPVTNSWTRTFLTTGVHLPETRMKIVLGANMLLDINALPQFDSYDYFFTFLGDANIFNNAFEFKLTEQYFRQAFTADSTTNAHYAITGMYHTLYLRNTCTIGYGLLAKGLAVLSLNGLVTKQRYDFSLRKAWFNGSSAEAGYYMTLGGVFPTAGYYIRGLYYPREKLGVELWSRALWDLPNEFVKKTLYVKSDLGAQAVYRLSGATETYCTITYTHFNPNTALDFPARFHIGTGFRLFLP